MLTLEIGGRRWEPDIRRLSDMRDLLYDKEWARSAEDMDLYYMYRDLYLSRSDRDRLKEHDLRYDITVIPPKMLGREYVKTAGHYHPCVAGTNVTYPEVYEVLEGEAMYLLQNESATDIVCVEALEGDKVVIPPGYGHVTINRSNKQLKMANFVCRSFSSIYEPYKRLGGAAYYYTKNGFIQNTRYENPAPLRWVEAPDEYKLHRFGFSKRTEMYPLVKNPQKLEFLTKPQDHLSLFDGLLE